MDHETFTLEKWEKWLDTIRIELHDLRLYRDTFKEVQSIINDNPQIQKPSIFYDQLILGHLALIVLGIRRQVKVDSTSISLARLLEQINKEPHFLTRERYVSLYQGSVVTQFANAHFDSFAGPTQQYIDANLVQEDIEKLRAKVLSCEEYADKKIAHTQANSDVKVPSFQELDDVIAFMEQLVIKYHLLFTAQHYTTLLPTVQYDWKAIFRYPWLRD